MRHGMRYTQALTIDQYERLHEWALALIDGSEVARIAFIATFDGIARARGLDPATIGPSSLGDRWFEAQRLPR